MNPNYWGVVIFILHCSVLTAWLLFYKWVGSVIDQRTQFYAHNPEAWSPPGFVCWDEWCPDLNCTGRPWGRHGVAEWYIDFCAITVKKMYELVDNWVNTHDVFCHTICSVSCLPFHFLLFCLLRQGINLLVVNRCPGTACSTAIVGWFTSCLQSFV